MAGCTVGDSTGSSTGGSTGGTAPDASTATGGSNGDNGGSGSNTTAAACTGAAYDPCTDNTQCMSQNCKTFGGAGLEVCTVTCTPGDDTACLQNGVQVRATTWVSKPLQPTTARGKTDGKGAAAFAADAKVGPPSRMRHVTTVQIAALILSLTALLAYVNARFIKLPSQIGLMAIPLAASLVLVVLDESGVIDAGSIEQVVAQANFGPTLLHGMLGLLLFAGSLHINIRELREHKWPVAVLSLGGTLLSTALVGLVMYAILGDARARPAPCCSVRSSRRPIRLRPRHAQIAGAPRPSRS